MLFKDLKAVARPAARRGARAVVKRGAQLARTSPFLYGHFQAFFRSRPALYRRLQRLLVANHAEPHSATGPPLMQDTGHSMTVAELPKGARTIYFALREAIQRNRQP